MVEIPRTSPHTRLWRVRPHTRQLRLRSLPAGAERSSFAIVEFEAVRQSQPLDRFAAEVCATNRVSRVNRKAALRALDTRLVPQKRHRSGPMATRRSGERTKRIAPAKLSPAQGGLLQICETQMTSETPLDRKRPIQ